MKKLGVVVLIGILVLLASCVSVSFEGLQMQKDMADYHVIKDFRKVISDTHLLGWGTNFGLVPLGQPDKDIFDAIRSEINKVSGDAAIDVTIQYRTTLVGTALNAFTAGLISPRSIIITGTIVKFD